MIDLNLLFLTSNISLPKVVSVKVTKLQRAHFTSCLLRLISIKDWSHSENQSTHFQNISCFHLMASKTIFVWSKASNAHPISRVEESCFIALIIFPREKVIKVICPSQKCYSQETFPFSFWLSLKLYFVIFCSFDKAGFDEIEIMNQNFCWVIIKKTVWISLPCLCFDLYAKVKDSDYKSMFFSRRESSSFTLPNLI